MAKLKDRWPELCKLVEEDDGLPTRDSGPWAEDKLYFWNRYIDITTRAMVGKPHWNGLTYVDLFAGPGVCTIRDTGRRIPGSCLIAAHAPKPFSKLIACDKDPEFVEACRLRLQQTPVADRFTVLVGDCNQRIGEITDLIPKRSLTLAFIDPTGLHDHFETIRRLTEDKQVDLLILFADHIDIVRNVEAYVQKSNSNLDLKLGPDSGWREQYHQLSNQNAENTCALFARIYRSQLQRHLGYVGFGSRTMRAPNGPLYQIIYASKHERGVEFWEKVTKKDRSGQRKLF